MIKRFLWLVATLCTCTLLAACAPPARPNGSYVGPTPVGLDLAGMDRGVAPGDDFFAYANGAWLKAQEIPADRGSYGSVAVVSERTREQVRALIDAAARAPAGSEERKIGDFYTAFMNEAGIEERGLAPVRPLLAAIDAINDAAALARALGATLHADVDVLNHTRLDTPHILGLWVAADLDDPTKYAAFVLQGGLGMPDRSYYLDESARMAEIRAKYRLHLAAMLRLAGLSDPEARATRVTDLERKIAAVHVPRSDTEDVRKGNNHWPRQEFASRAPGLDWSAFFGAAGLDRQPEVVVWQPSALIGIAALVGTEPLQTWKDYLTLHLLEEAADGLPRAFAMEHFAFHGRVLIGTPEPRARWKRAVDATTDAMGQAIGKLYVTRYFSPADKRRAEEMAQNLIRAFDRRVDRLAWVAPITKQRAKAKLRALRVEVGYPEHWRDYGGLEIVPDDALGNVDRAARFEYRRNLAKLGRPVDRGEWAMDPQLVNAVNLPVLNALQFPAANLQPPFFDPGRPAVMDYGAMGAIIGHEISHSFDDQGALFDEQGRLANWWTSEDFEHFKAATARLARQYDGYRPLPDLAVNGAMTLSENIADLVGLAVAYDAYRLSLGGREAPPDQGLTGDQQFFLAYAQSWRTKVREPALRRRLLTDGHAPPEYRADTVRNLDAWYAAFAVHQDQRLYLAPSERVLVW